jgi:antitoxin VapB
MAHAFRSYCRVILLGSAGILDNVPKVFINGRSQAVRLPKEFRFSGNDVFINKIGKIVILIPKDDPWASLANSLDQFTDDYMETRDQPPQDSREPL